MLKSLLLQRLLIFNVMGFYGVYLAHQMGWLVQVWGADISKLSSAIVVLFLLILGSTFVQGWKVANSVNIVRTRGAAYWDNAFLVVCKKRLLKIAHIDRAAGWMATLGLIGTVVGFIIAFMGIDMNLVGDASGVQQLAAQLVSGMGTALVTTLIGAIAGLWTEINYKMIQTMAASVVEEIR